VADEKERLRRVRLRRRKRKPAREAGFFVHADRDFVKAKRVFVIRDQVCLKTIYSCGLRLALPKPEIQIRSSRKRFHQGSGEVS
jgi:hypothetical protein